VTEKDEKLYRFISLDGYTFKERLSIRLADLVFFFCIKVLGTSTRFEVLGLENLDKVEASGNTPILCFWHDRIFLSTYFWRNRGIVVLTSKSFDGEYIARFIQRFGFGAVRGSSSQGGARALIEMVKAARSGHPMAFTVDGPRGPRHKTKAGPVILAKKSGQPIVPFVIEPRRNWNAKSWDKMQIPTPFTRAITIIGEPISVDSDADDAMVDAKLAELQIALDTLNERAAEWRERQ
jgi:lysophospholipid acyltransferase (LPLAT)-like uncharacterized protein